MAGQAVIGALRIVIGADTALLEKGLKDAQSSLKGFSSTLGKAGAIAAATFTTALTGIAIGIRGALDEADKMGKMAQSVGVTVEEFSKLAHVAKLSDVSIEDLSKSMVVLSKNMEAATRDPSGQMAKTFNTVFGDASWKKVKDAGGMIEKLAGQFEKWGDGAGKVDIARTLMGKGGTTLIPMLNEGAEAMRKGKEEAILFGRVISGPMATSAQLVNDNMERMSSILGGVFLRVMEQLLPYLEAFSTWMLEQSSSATNFDWVTSVAYALRVLNFEIAAVRIEFQGLAKEAPSLGKIAAMLTFPNPISIIQGIKAWKDYTAAGDTTYEAMQKLRAEFDAATLRIQANTEAMKTSTAVMENMHDVAYKLATQLPPPPKIGSASEDEKRANEAEQRLKKILDRAKQSFEETRTPAEKFAMTVSEINEEFAAGGYGIDTFNRRMKQAKDAMNQFKEEAVGVHNALESAFVDAITGAKKLQDVLGSLIKDLARLAAQSAFKQLFGDNMFNPSPGSTPLLKLPPIPSSTPASALSPASSPFSNNRELAGAGPAGGGVVFNVENIDAKGAQKGVGEEIVGALTRFVDTPLFKQKSMAAVREGQSRRVM
jgi:hypothetical protein